MTESTFQAFNTRRLTWMYIAALSMVGLLTIAGQTVVQRALLKLEGDSGTVNTAGRQRMLSQRLTQRVLAAQQNIFLDSQAEHFAELRKMRDLWESRQKSLAAGASLDQGAEGNSQTIRDLFRSIQPDFTEVLAVVDRLLEGHTQGASLSMTEEELRQMLSHSDKFLAGMDRIVLQFEIEARTRVAKLQATERLLLLATLVVLFCEGLLIFSPAIASIRTTFEELQRVSQQLVVAKDQAESANRAKTSFMTRLSHELRTPLHAIIGMLDLLRRGRLPRTQQRQVQLTNQAAQALKTLVDDLLDVTGIEAGGELPIVNRPLLISKLIQHAVGVMLPIAKKKNIELTATIDPDFPASVLGDAKRLRQVVYNLLQNAIRYSDNGRIDCDCFVESLDQASKSKRYALRIRDSGCGIPLADQARIFESLARRHDTRAATSFGRSLGLGLPITAGIVRAMGGELQLESQEGQGTTFTLWLPLTECPPQKTKRLNRKHETGNLATVGHALVVDDEMTNRLLLKAYLKRLGYKVRTADTKVRAIELCGVRTPDLIMLDKHLGDQDGHTFASQLHARHEGPLPCIILLTADASYQLTPADRAFGVTQVLYKPLRFATLSKELNGLSNKTDVETNFSELQQRLQSLVRQHWQNDVLELKELLDQGKFTQLACSAHRVAGGLGNAGLIGAANLAAHLETNADAAKIDEAKSTLDLLEMAMQLETIPPDDSNLS